MNVELECIAKLAEFGNCRFTESTSYTLVKGETVADLAKLSMLSLHDIETVMVNNTIASLETVLSEGDRVELAPVFGLE